MTADNWLMGLEPNVQYPSIVDDGGAAPECSDECRCSTRHGSGVPIWCRDAPYTSFRCRSFRELAGAGFGLSCARRWARVYSFPENKGRMVHILAPAEQENGDVNFYRLDLWQRQKLRGPRPAVEVVGGATMDYDQCAEWLVDLAHRRAVNADSFQRFQCISRPQMPLQPDIRLAWIGPTIVGGQVMAERLAAIGEVYDAVVPHVAPI